MLLYISISPTDIRKDGPEMSIIKGIQRATKDGSVKLTGIDHERMSFRCGQRAFAVLTPKAIQEFIARPAPLSIIIDLTPYTKGPCVSVAVTTHDLNRGHKKGPIAAAIQRTFPDADRIRVGRQVIHFTTQVGKFLAITTNDMIQWMSAYERGRDVTPLTVTVFQQ